MLNNKNFLEKRFITGFSKTSSGNMAIANDPLSPSFSLNIHGSYSQKTTQGNQLLPYPYTNESKTQNGITFTVNSDGSVTVNGTSTAFSSFQILGSAQVSGEVNIPGNYISGGNNDVQIGIYHNDGNNNYITLAYNQSGFTEIDKSVSDNNGYVELRVNAGKTINNVTIYPMLSNEQNIDWEPYTGGEKSPNPNYPSEPTMLGETSVSSNLYNFRDTMSVTNGAMADEDGWITVTGDNSNGESTLYANYFSNPLLNIKPNTQYNLIVEIKNVSGTGYLTPSSNDATSSIQQFVFQSDMVSYFEALQDGQVINYIVTSKEDLSSNDITIGLRSFIAFNVGQSGTITFRISILENTSVTPDNFVYEPYANIILQQSNKNLLDYNLPVENYYYNSNGVKTKDDVLTYVNQKIYAIPNTSYYFSSSNKIGINSNIRVCEYTFNGDFIKRTLANSQTLLFMTTDETGYIIISIDKSPSLYYENPQLEIGTTVSDYVPHQGNNYYINLDDNLVEAVSSNYYDNLNIDLLGNCKLTKNIAKVIYDGSDDENWNIDSSANNIYQFSALPNNGQYFNTPDVTAISNYYFGVGFQNSWEEDNVVTVSFNGRIRIMTSLQSTVEEFKTWLSTHNISFWYLLASPQELELPNLDKPITLFEGENIFTVGSNLPTTLDITYQSRAN